MENYQKDRRNLLKLLGIGGGSMLLGNPRLPLALAADVYPAGRITWICPLKPGGGYDLIARSIAPYLEKYLKEASKQAGDVGVVVKNIPEAGGRRAYSTIQNAKGDGYTIGDFNTGFISETIVKKSDIDFSRYTYLVRQGVSIRLILTPKNGFKTWDEMMQAGKEKELRWAAASFGQGGHVTSILIKEAAKVPARLVNFPSGSENVNALLRGDVQLGTVGEEAAKAMVEAGELRILAVVSEKSEYPGVPSIAQLGYPELVDPCKIERMVIGPPDMQSDVKDTLISAFKKVFSDKDFLDKARKLSFDPDPLYGQDAERIALQIAKYYEEKASVLTKYLQ